MKSFFAKTEDGYIHFCEFEILVAYLRLKLLIIIKKLRTFQFRDTVDHNFKYISTVYILYYKLNDICRSKSQVVDHKSKNKENTNTMKG